MSRRPNSILPKLYSDEQKRLIEWKKIAIPALGYTNLAMRNPAEKAHVRKQMAKLIALLIPQVVAEIRPQQDLDLRWNNPVSVVSPYRLIYLANRSSSVWFSHSNLQKDSKNKYFITTYSFTGP